MKIHQSMFNQLITTASFATALILCSCGGGGGGGNNDSNGGINAPYTLFPDNPDSDAEPTSCTVTIPSISDNQGNTYSITFTCNSDNPGDAAGIITSASVTVKESSNTRTSGDSLGWWSNNYSNSGNALEHLHFSYDNSYGSKGFYIDLQINKLVIDSAPIYDNNKNLISISGTISSGEALIRVSGVTRDETKFVANETKVNITYN